MKAMKAMKAAVAILAQGSSLLPSAEASPAPSEHSLRNGQGDEGDEGCGDEGDEGNEGEEGQQEDGQGGRFPRRQHWWRHDLEEGRPYQEQAGPDREQEAVGAGEEDVRLWHRQVDCGRAEGS